MSKTHLFNLFVFFEVLLAASYGLMLHGSGKARVSAWLSPQRPGPGIECGDPGFRPGA